MFLVHKQGYVAGSKLVDGMLPYDFFCEDDPAINLFVFTGEQVKGKGIQEQTLWGFARLDRFEALTRTLTASPRNAGWFHSVNVLTSPAQNGTQTVKFQPVVKIIKHSFGLGKALRKPEYEIHTTDGDIYFTRTLAEPAAACKVIYSNN